MLPCRESRESGPKCVHGRRYRVQRLINTRCFAASWLAVPLYYRLGSGCIRDGMQIAGTLYPSRSPEYVESEVSLEGGGSNTVWVCAIQRRLQFREL